jgi:eukaryotic-like serine/threonine-protein kinase
MRTIRLLIISAIIVCGTIQSNQSQILNDPLKWKYSTSGAIYASPLIHNDTLFIGNLDSVFYAIDITNGQKLWSCKTKSQINTTASIYNDLICFASGNYFYVLDMKGNLKTEFKMYDDPAVIQSDPWDYFNPSPQLVDSIAYIGTEKNLVYGINIKNGEQVFKCQGTDGDFTIQTTLAIYNGKIFFGNYNGFFYAYDLKTAHKVWEYDTNKEAKARGGADPKILLLGNAAIYNGTVCFGGRGGNFYCMDAETGTQKWKYRDPDGLWILGLTIQDSSFYMGSSYQRVVRSVNGNTGKQNWRSGVDHISYGSPYIDSTYAFFGTGDDATMDKGSLFAFDKVSGVVRDKFAVDGRVQSSPTIYRDIIYFGSSSGNIYAVDKQKFVNVPRPKIVLKNTSKIFLGSLAEDTLADTTMYISNLGDATDSVTFVPPKKEITFSPAYLKIGPGDSAAVKVILNTKGLKPVEYTWYLQAISNFSALHELVQRKLGFKIKEKVGIGNTESDGIVSLNLYPNPLKGIGMIQYKLAKKSDIFLALYDVLGKQVAVIDKCQRFKGTYRIPINSSAFGPGIYYCILTANGYSSTQKIVVVR